MRDWVGCAAEGPGGDQGSEGRGLGSRFLGLREEGLGSELLV